MMETLVRKFTGKTELLQPASRITDEIESTQQQLVKASRVFDDACLDMAEGKAGAERRKQRAAAKKLGLAKRLDELHGAFRSAKYRESEAIETARAEELAEQWEKTFSLADKRQLIIKKMAAQVEAFADAYNELLSLNNELYGMTPYKPDLDGAFMRVPMIETAVRLEMVRCGLPWAIAHPWGAESIPPLVSKTENLPDLFRQWRDQSRA